MATYLVPNETAVQDTLQFLYGEDLEVASAAAPDTGKAICGVYVSTHGTPHLKLDSVYASVSDAPDAARALLDGASGPAFKVDIPRHGSGVISLMS